MAIHVALEHKTVYTFDRPVRLGPHTVRLRPAPHSRTPVLAYSLTVTPEEHFLNWQQDPFGNFGARLVFPEKTRQLSITVDLIADMTVINPFDFFVEEDAEHYPFTYEPGLERDLGPYLVTEEPGPHLAEWLAAVPRPKASDEMRTIDFLVDLNRRLRQDIAYTVRMEPGVQDPDVTLDKRLGSCRDTGWLLVQIARHLGIAARFVSGYLVQLRSDEKSLDGPSGPAEDFTDLHAWAEVFLPGAGWVGLDPTSGLLAGEGHIPLAATPEPSSAAPVSGIIEPAEVTFEFANTVRRIHEDPRVTYPYTDEQWARIDALGAAIDDRLVAGDVRLTQGGEPTFVAIDDMESPQWTIAADGEDKRRMAGELARRLAKRWAPGALMHYGQGKWYPGEPLPRWQIGVLWRTDDVPLWSHPDLLADPSEPGTATGAQAEKLAITIAAELGVDADHCIAAYEDEVERLLLESRLPSGDPPPIELDPEDPRLNAAAERAALVSTLDAAAGDPVGWAIPLFRVAEGGGQWATTTWGLRRGHLFLLGGDSPMGLRLPLGSLGWVAPPLDPDRSEFEPRDELPAPSELVITKAVPTPAGALEVPLKEAPPTALCVEERDGHVHVFLPPIVKFDDEVELLDAIGRAASALDLPVILEGYAPPRDPRARELMVTPDPGVIEVNLPPASSWPELEQLTTELYEEARACRLGTEKFDVDGTHTGTGGGNHLTLGGAEAVDSPMLRRPDLLASLVSYWQHHPSLSYLFSGRFIGPTSQAPRVDEGRPENLYELEIAIRQLDEAGDEPPRWLVDRLFRHLLTDITGNTHRAEFCIDKLFNPDSERGRLGLVELRGFEMPPHARMALVQALLVRSLVARFWDEPYRGDLVRWGTELQDKFLLPWFAIADIEEVTQDLQRFGIDFETAWLAPFLEFRFPRIGSTTIAGTRIELRNAIEPWHVLGEEVSMGGTSRYVDSSVERIQVLVEGLTESRHILTCNGIPVPLQPTSTPGTVVAGVRFRAWAPPSALHPMIGVHSPLVFDLVDRWSGRSLGGCTYHVVHPGGLAYDHFPVNANEAEARRVPRFEALGHTPGPIDVAALDAAALGVRHEYPRTLDLRRYAPIA